MAAYLWIRGCVGGPSAGVVPGRGAALESWLYSCEMFVCSGMREDGGFLRNVEFAVSRADGVASMEVEAAFASDSSSLSAQRRATGNPGEHRAYRCGRRARGRTGDAMVYLGDPCRLSGTSLAKLLLVCVSTTAPSGGQLVLKGCGPWRVDQKSSPVIIFT